MTTDTFIIISLTTIYFGLTYTYYSSKYNIQLWRIKRSIDKEIKLMLKLDYINKEKYKELNKLLTIESVKRQGFYPLIIDVTLLINSLMKDSLLYTDGVALIGKHFDRLNFFKLYTSDDIFNQFVKIWIDVLEDENINNKKERLIELISETELVHIIMSYIPDNIDLKEGMPDYEIINIDSMTEIELDTLNKIMVVSDNNNIPYHRKLNYYYNIIKLSFLKKN